MLLLLCRSLLISQLYSRGEEIWKLTAALIKNYMVKNNFVLTQQEANNLALQ